VCSTCHSIQYIAFRNLVGVTHDETAAKKLAAEFEVEDAAPNDEGEMFERPAKLFDRYASPDLQLTLVSYSGRVCICVRLQYFVYCWKIYWYSAGTEQRAYTNHGSQRLHVTHAQGSSIARIVHYRAVVLHTSPCTICHTVSSAHYKQAAKNSLEF
jgi:cytochrome c1